MPKATVKPKQPTDTPVVEEEPVLTIEDEDGKAISPAELVESLAELKDRVKAAGMLPLRNVITSYASTIVSAVDGLLGALEGKKKKK
jgi:effector-binding domain-containing protein